MHTSCQKQDASASRIHLSRSSLLFPCDGGRQTVEISSDGEWEAFSTAPAGITLDPKSGKGTVCMNVTADGNIGNRRPKEYIIFRLRHSPVCDTLIVYQNQTSGETITDVKQVNTFESGDVLSLRESDIPYIESIIRTPFASEHPECVDRIASYSFTFRQQPEEIQYTVGIPDENGRIAAVNRGAPGLRPRMLFPRTA